MEAKGQFGRQAGWMVAAHLGEAAPEGWRPRARCPMLRMRVQANRLQNLAPMKGWCSIQSQKTLTSVSNRAGMKKPDSKVPKVCTAAV